ncbi:helicase C-terminal domain-containing protein [Limnoraphis robusta]|uniref:Helicase n=1 Tax=Limnoraphis robusta CS-951 TaxID=1637645 RepID=A0A0F5YL82_9CYAN|nr:helicase-related protein [Limnoraphis robusta]KKD39659.1 helicase [Limnoraphis robusta CS-951]
MNSNLEQASIWGRVFEIAVQRGVIAYLLDCKFLNEEHPQLEPWRKVKISQLSKHLIQALKETQTLPVHDIYVEERIQEYLRHLLVLGYGLGWTSLRECLNHYKPSRTMKLEAFWCPLTLPGETDNRELEPKKTAEEFHQAFNILDLFDPFLVTQGQPGRADFLLWLSPTEEQLKKRQPPQDFILCFEFSFNAPLELKDFRLETAHCQEINRYARYLDARGSFSRICAEVQGDQLQVSSKLEKHLFVFSGKDKPLYKLSQASSYTYQLVDLLKKKKRLQNSCLTRAMAITSNGVESLSAHFNSENNPQVKLMKSLGEAYEHLIKHKDPENFNAEIKVVFNTLLNSLPPALKKQAKRYFKPTHSFDKHLSMDFSETVEDFFKPMQTFDRQDILEAIEETEKLQAYFETSPRSAIEPYLTQPSLTLRDAHKSAIKAGLDSAISGRLNVIALEGNPGIGKTASVVSFLKEQRDGFLFLYASPRVVINQNVTQDLAQERGEKTGILTVTTNSLLISSAKTYYEEKIAPQEQKPKKIDGLVVVNGVDHLQHPVKSSILFINPQQEEEINNDLASIQRYKKSINERDELVNTKINPGVLRTLATGTRHLLEKNPQVQQVVLTVATQGYRNLSQGTTIEALGKLFRNRVNTQPGINERLEFAKRVPTIIVMIDEVAGDGAGALFVDEIAKWLQEQFILPFKDSPFRVILIVADASLSNEIVLTNFLEAGKRVPDKVLISPSRGKEAFRVTETELKIGGNKHSALHIMTNSYPATELTIDYSIRLSLITPELTSDGKPQSIKSAIRQQSESVLLNNAWQEINKGLKNNAQQIIFFAQDKAFLRKLKGMLTEGDQQLFSKDDVQVIDQSVLPRERLRLVTEPQRDNVKVFLMTSSGARGVSFPKADWIIASFPRFSVEASLMEIAQLIYRGRGQYTHPETGEKCSGENIPRRLVLLINDFFIPSETVDQERQWLRQSSDLLTLLLMLRSTILTRIKGDAGLRKQRLAFVPVGRIGDEELIQLISDDIQQFLQEANVFVNDSSYSSEFKGLVKKGQQFVEDLFKDFRLSGRTTKKDRVSYANYPTLEALVKTISRPSSPLLPKVNDPTLQIPDYLTCLGAFWWEDWGDRQIQEKYSFSESQAKIREARKQLMGILHQIGECQKIPRKLRDPARDIHKILLRENNAEWREYSIIEEIKSNDVMIALPLDYPQFWKPPFNSDGVERKQEFVDPETWRNALGRTLTPQGSVIPIIAKYQDFPWAAVASRHSISSLELAFNNRYFMASSELNLLNTILLEDPE